MGVISVGVISVGEIHFPMVNLEGSVSNSSKLVAYKDIVVVMQRPCRVC